MKCYRLLLLDNKGHLLGSRTIECETDCKAIKLAETIPGPFALIEIWRGGDPVCMSVNPKVSSVLKFVPSANRDDGS